MTETTSREDQPARGSVGDEDEVATQDSRRTTGQLSPRPSHSPATGAVRLLLAVWLMASAVRTLADPQQATTEQTIPLGALLPIAGLSFALGAFLLTGFMSRVAGLIMVALGVWQTASFGVAFAPAVLVLGGVYLALRGGGAWAMDIYVQKMQDRVRQREASR